MPPSKKNSPVALTRCSLVLPNLPFSAFMMSGCFAVGFYKQMVSWPHHIRPTRCMCRRSFNLLNVWILTGLFLTKCPTWSHSPLCGWPTLLMLTTSSSCFILHSSYWLPHAFFPSPPHFQVLTVIIGGSKFLLSRTKTSSPHTSRSLVILSCTTFFFFLKMH